MTKVMKPQAINRQSLAQSSPSGFHRVIVSWNDTRAANRQGAQRLCGQQRQWHLPTQPILGVTKVYGLMSGVIVIP